MSSRAKRYDVDWSDTNMALARVNEAMRETGARWVASPETLSIGVVVATVEVEDAALWRKIAKPLKMRLMNRRVDYMTLDGVEDER